jgi:hypothetical protein
LATKVHCSALQDLNTRTKIIYGFIDPRYYVLRKIHIFIDNGEFMVQKIASLTRWEIMEDSSNPGFIILMDYNAKNQDETKQLLIEKSFLQAYLQKNPIADRIILEKVVQS